MVYLRWDEVSVSGLDQMIFGLAETWTEVDETGSVRRELGFDAAGHICHRCPSQRYRYGTYGLFDMATIAVEGRGNEIAADEFERRWQEDEFAV